jgi:hypothetical protein
MTSVGFTDVIPARQKRRLSVEMQLTLRLMLFSFFGLGLPRVFTSTAAHTLFIDAYGPKLIPYAYLAEALLVPLFGHLYIKADEKFSLRSLIAGSMAIDLFMLVALWFGFTFVEAKPVAFVGMVWFETEFVFCSLWLWGMATQLMTLRQGKRLFGYISAGEPTAVILGGLLTPLLLHYVGPQDLFLLSALGVAVGIVLVFNITKTFKPQRDAEGGEHEETTAISGGRKWYSDRYVQVLVGIVVISQFAYFFTDSAFYLEAGNRFPEEADLGAFIGKYMAAVGVVSLITSLFVSGPLVKRFGLKSALLMLPIMLASTAAVASVLGIGFGAAGAVFWVVVVMKTIDQSVRYTVDKTSSVTLYAPLPAAQRNQVQTALESVIEPVVGGISGLLLALFVQLLGFGSVAVVTVVFVVTAAWVMLVVIQDRFYQKALRTALQARRMGDGQLTVEDPAAIAVIMEALESDEVGEVLNGLSLAERIPNFNVIACYHRLIAHPAPEIRHDVLSRIERLGFGSVPAAIVAERIRVESDPVLRSEALRTFATLDPDGALDCLEPYLTSPDEPMRREAYVGLLRHGGIEGILCAGEPLLLALRSDDAEERRFAASVLEGTHSPGFARALTKLMVDPEASVRSAALRAVGVAQTPSMWPSAVALLNDEIGDVSRTAASILATAGDAAVEPLVDLLDSEDVRSEARRLAARVLGEIGSERARGELVLRLALHDRKIAESVLFAIPVTHASQDDTTQKRLMTRLGEILQDAAHATAWRTTLTVTPLPDIDLVLHRALGDQIEDDIRSIFRLLTLIYPEARLSDTYQSFRFGDPARKAVAMEALEIALRNEYRAAVLAFIEHESDGERLQALPVAMRSEAIASNDLPTYIAMQPASLVSPWTRAASLYSAIQLGQLSTLTLAGAPFMTEPLCREMIDNRKGRTDVLTIEKVLLLRNTPIFSAVREEHLVDVAQRAEPVELAKDAVLFTAGDMGNSMFVVVDGRIRIHIGDKTLAELGAREVVGEMAAVDPEARSASVSAMESSLLLRISNQNLELLIDQDPDVARGIIKVLCFRLRQSAAKPVIKPPSTVN